MKLKHFVFAIAVALTGAAAGFSFGSSEEAAPPADFLITIAPSEGGAKLTCTHGCTWKELTFNCGDRRPCLTAIDGLGMASGR